MVGAAAAIAAAVGPLLGGFVTTYLSWRVGFALEVVIITVVLSQIRLVRDVPYTGSRKVDVVGAVLSVIGMGGVVLGILVWQEGGEYVVLLVAVGAVALGSLAWWLLAQAGRSGDVDRSRPLPAPELHLGDLRPDPPAGHIRRRHDRPAALPPDDAGVQRHAGRTLHGAAVADHVRHGPAGRQEGREAATGGDHPCGFVLAAVGMGLIVPLVPQGRQRVVPGDPAGDRRRRARAAGVPAEQLHAGASRGSRVSEAAGVNSAAGSFGLSFGLAVAGGILLATLSFSFTNQAEQPDHPAGRTAADLAPRSNTTPK